MVADIGDIVKVVNEGHIYPSYKDFFNEQGFPKLVNRHQSYCRGVNVGRVLFKGMHRHGYELLYAVELGADGGGIVIVGERGIEFVDDGACWTLPEIEKGEVSVNDLLGF